jgi:hypothetical protein
MRITATVAGVGLLTLGLLSSSRLAFAQANPTATHVGHILESFAQAPNAQGLLPTALAEAGTAAQHAELASRDLANLNAMKMHAGHVLHAVSPAQGSSGPGQGFGVKRAAEGIAQHIGFATNAEGASENVRTHAGHITAAARTVSARADEIVALVGRIQEAGSAADAAPLVTQLKTLADQLVAGRDANGDGRITWEEGEGGLQHVEQHMGLLTRGEGG